MHWQYIPPLDGDMNLLWYNVPDLRKDCTCNSALPSACCWLALPWGWVQQKIESLIVLSWASRHFFSGDKFSPFLLWKFLEGSLAKPQPHTWDWHPFWDKLGDGGQLLSKTGKETGVWISYIRNEMFSLRVIKEQLWGG